MRDVRMQFTNKSSALLATTVASANASVLAIERDPQLVSMLHDTTAEELKNVRGLSCEG